MRIALFSDIHANLPALGACLAAIDAAAPDAVYCLGDLVGYHVWPNEVIDAIRRRGIPTIMGNYDEGIGTGSNDCGCAYKTDEEKAMGQVSIAYTNAVVTDASRAYLRTLPAHIRVEFRIDGHPLTLLLVHGSPRRINEYLFEDRPDKSLLHLIEEAGADILCFGHTHQPWHRVLHDAAGRPRHAVNTGSVGKPKDGDPRGCFALLTIEPGDPYAVQVAFVRFEYEVEKAATAIEGSPLPAAYAEKLRTGK
ncbi:MAG: metallophosphoesterase [Chitinophagaceae bacterium]|nr:MAG: metallophosphoesterase [Chitinophagaceae bacterium]